MSRLAEEMVLTTEWFFGRPLRGAKLIARHLMTFILIPTLLPAPVLMFVGLREVLNKFMVS